MTIKIPTYGLLAALWMLLVLVGCTNEEDTPHARTYSGERFSINLQLGTRVGVTSDDEIDNVRVIVFTDRGELVSNKLQKPDNVSNTYSVSTEVARGTNNFYVICNETSELTSKLEAVVGEADIESTTFQAVGITPPIPMYGKVINALVTAKRDGSNTRVTVNGVESDVLKVDVARMMSKLSLTVIKKVTGEDDFVVESMSYRICRMPKYMTIKEGQISPTDSWASEQRVDGTGTLANNGQYIITEGNYQIPDGVDNISFPDLYIPEHILEAKENIDQCTYLIISTRCKLKDGIMADVLYRLNIGTKPPLNMDLIRNNHYNIFATVTGLGAMGFHAEIVPKTMVELPVTWQEYTGLFINSELQTEFGVTKNIDLDYSQYFGILKWNAGTTIGVKEVLFKYGSIIPVSATNTNTAFDPSADVIWKPLTYTSGITAWGDIVCVDKDTNIPEHTPENIAKGIGDPCRLVGLLDDEIKSGIIDNKMWRMANPEEYNHLIVAANELGSNDGFLSFHYLLEPNTASRDADGNLLAKALNGTYWSSQGGNAFTFTSPNQSTVSIAQDNPQKAYAIRCVRVKPPVSSLSASSGHIIYYNGVTNSATSISQTNVPYWKIRYNSGDGEGEVTWSGSEGFFSNGPTYSVTASPDIYATRTFVYDITGYGLDGKVYTPQYHIIQKPIEYRLSFMNAIVPELNFKYGYHRIPAAGGTFNVTARIDPTLTTEQLANIKWQMIFGEVLSDGSLKETCRGTLAKIGESSVIIIPRNTSGDLLNVAFSVGIENPDTRLIIKYERNELMQEKP